MKKASVKHKKKQKIQLYVVIAMVILVIGTGLAIVFPATKQDLRSRAAGSDITVVSSVKGDTSGTVNASQVTLPAPSGVQAGDVLVALLQADYGHIGGTLPDGWTLIKELNEKDDLAAHTYYKVATGTEPANYTWTIINTDNTKKAKKNEALGGGTIMAFRGVDTQNPIFASAINPETVDHTKVDCPSVNAPAGGMLLCEFVDDDPATAVTVPPSMTQVNYFTINNNDTHTSAYEKIANAGDTGVREESITVPPAEEGNGNNDIGIGIVLQPAGTSASGSGPSTSYSLGGINNASSSSNANSSISPSSAPSVPTTSAPTGDMSFVMQILALLVALLKGLFNF